MQSTGRKCTSSAISKSEEPRHGQKTVTQLLRSHQCIALHGLAIKQLVFEWLMNQKPHLTPNEATDFANRSGRWPLLSGNK